MNSLRLGRHLLRLHILDTANGLAHRQPPPQSTGQLFWFSTHWGWQMPFPHRQTQSKAQVTKFSPQAGSHLRSPHRQPAPQSAGQLPENSPHSGWQRPLPHRQPPQSEGQLSDDSPHWGWHAPSPQKDSGGQGLQSMGQLATFSPQPGWQRPLPQTQGLPQSAGQVFGSSAHWGSHLPSPQNDPGGQGPQSAGQLTGDSPHWGEHRPSPQKVLGGHGPQSAGQVPWFSPHWGWHSSFPQMHTAPQSVEHEKVSSPQTSWQTPFPQKHASQSWGQVTESSPQSGSQKLLPQVQLPTHCLEAGLQVRPSSTQLSQAPPLFPHASCAVPSRHWPSSVQQPAEQVSGPHGSPPAPPPVPSVPEPSVDRPHPAASAEKRAARRTSKRTGGVRRP